MTHREVAQIGEACLLPVAMALYGLEGYETRLVEHHDGGRNAVYICGKEGLGEKVLRIIFLNDRSREDILGEVEFIRYLYDHGGSVANVINSRNGNLVEEIICHSHTFFVCLFEKAQGEQLAENHYQYREGVPITEYFYDCGRVLGKLHQLSKEYVPVHRRYGFFDKYNEAYINELIPDSLSLLKEKLIGLLKALDGIGRDSQSYGMVHFDYSDGNYMIDYGSGEITVFDFDNSCFCWYLFDLANTWIHGVGWIQFEKDAVKRKTFMDDYFATVLAGYQSETSIDQRILDQLPLFIQVTVLEGIVDAFEVMRDNGDEPECDEELSYLIKCMESDIPYMGFFHEVYSCETPFQTEVQTI